jgi:hypothetical protein
MDALQGQGLSDEAGANAQPETALPVQRVVWVPLVLIERSSFMGRWRN